MGVGQGAGRDTAGPRVVPMGYRQKFGIWSPWVTVVPRVWLLWETTGSSLIAMGYRQAAERVAVGDGRPQALLPRVTAGPRMVAVGYNPPGNGCGGMQLDPRVVTVGYSWACGSHRPRHMG